MKPLSPEKKKAYRKLLKRRALLAYFIAHPEKMNDEPTIATAMAIADQIADAKFELMEGPANVATSEA